SPGHQRFRVGVQQVVELVLDGEEAIAVVEATGAAGENLAHCPADVAAGTETLRSFAAEDHGYHRRIGRPCLQALDEQFAHLEVQGIQLPRAVQPCDAERAAATCRSSLETYRRPPAGRGRCGHVLSILHASLRYRIQAGGSVMRTSFHFGSSSLPLRPRVPA